MLYEEKLPIGACDVAQVRMYEHNGETLSLAIGTMPDEYGRGCTHTAEIDLTDDEVTHLIAALQAGQHEIRVRRGIDCPLEWRHYTVTVAGSERHDGDAGSTYVMRRASLVQAIDETIRHHADETDDDDVICVTAQTFEGVPGKNWLYQWSYL